MNFSKILGVSLALVAGSVGVAHAINPATVPAANRVYFSGATATDNILESVLILRTNGVCQPIGIDIYRGTNQRVIACNAAIPGLVGQPIAFFKESLGGSGNGTNPVANATNLQFLDVDNLAFACTGGPTSVAQTATLNAYTERTGCTPSLPRVPVAGIADVEPRLLGAAQTQINALTTQGVLGIVFAPAVSLNLYRALQQAQGLATNDNPENIPNLTSAQIRGLYTGFYNDWSQFDDLVPFLPTETGVYYCRRGDTSGTQASYESYLLNERCVAGVTGFVEASAPACERPGCEYSGTFANDQVFAGFSSGDVRLCLDARNDQGRWAIGVLSTEQVYNNTDRQFRWTRIDGAPPTLEAVANGRYSFFTENVINRRTGALSASQTTVVNYLAANLGQTSVISGVNTAFQANPHGDGGVIAVPNFGTITPNPSPVSQATMRLTPINSQVRNGNNCTPPISAGNQQSGGL